MRHLIRVLIEHKVAKLGCFFVIALVAIGVSIVSKSILGWLHFNEAQRAAMSEEITDDFIHLVLLTMFGCGLFMISRRVLAELRSETQPLPPLLRPPPLPSAPPPKIKSPKRRLPQ